MLPRPTTAAIRLFSTSPGSLPLRRPAPAAGQSARCAPQSMRRRTAGSCVWGVGGQAGEHRWHPLRPLSQPDWSSGRASQNTHAAGAAVACKAAVERLQQHQHNAAAAGRMEASRVQGCSHSPVKAFGCSACSPSASPGSPVPPLAATVGREQMAVCNRRACPACCCRHRCCCRQRHSPLNARSTAGALGSSACCHRAGGCCPCC